MKTQKISALAILNGKEQKELVGIVFYDEPTRKRIIYTCSEADEQEIEKFLNGNCGASKVYYGSGGGGRGGDGNGGGEGGRGGDAGSCV